jgi:acyl-CoA thioesterase-2
MSCHFVSQAKFAPADVSVRALRNGSSAAVHAASVTQDGSTVVETTCWSAERNEGPEHMDIRPPAVVPRAEATPEAGELDWLPFAKNLDVAFVPRGEEIAPRWSAWTSLRARATFDDPWLDAARSLILLDISGFSAAAMHHGTDASFIAPSLDLHVSFHHDSRDAPWLLMDSHSPLSIDGVLAWRGALWTEDGRIAAMGTGQNAWRRT